jgi:hypothetical protein
MMSGRRFGRRRDVARAMVAVAGRGEADGAADGPILLVAGRFSTVVG